MENNPTSAPNGVSNNDKLTPEEARVYLENTEPCSLAFVSQKEVAPQGFYVTAKDFANMITLPSKALNTGILPGEQGPALVTTKAAEITEHGNNIVDVTGRSQNVPEEKEDGSRKAARESIEVRKSAEDKFNRNSGNRQSGEPEGLNDNR